MTTVAEREGRGGTGWTAIVAAVGGAAFVGFGLWAMVAPRSFHDFAAFEPYNQHYVQDIGSFQIGLGAVLVASLVWRDGLLVALAGNAVGAVLHLLSHVLDRSLGGSASDFVVLGAVALLLVFAAGARLQALRR